MERKHSFNFEGGSILARMGASWFVSYTYYLTVDKEHKNWMFCETIKMRQSFFASSCKYHNYWLQKILKMNTKRLRSNYLALRGEDVIKMAKEIIEKKQH